MKNTHKPENDTRLVPMLGHSHVSYNMVQMFIMIKEQFVSSAILWYFILSYQQICHKSTISVVNVYISTSINHINSLSHYQIQPLVFTNKLYSICIL